MTESHIPKFPDPTYKVDRYDIEARVIQLLRGLTYKDWAFTLGVDAAAMWICVSFPDPNGEQHGRKWRLSYHATDTEVLQTCLKAVLTAEEHEAREKFEFKGRAIYGPHYKIDDLIKLYDSAVLDSRVPAQTK